MMTVFIFSSQDGIDTLNTSGAFIATIESNLKDNKSSQVGSNVDNKTDKKDTLENKEYKYKYSNKIQRIVRKNAHYFLYMVGGIILSVFFCAIERKKSGKNEKSIAKRSMITHKKEMFFAIVTGILYAFLDEFHQKFVPGRTSSLKDVFIDSIGVITGVTIFNVLKIIMNKRKIKNGGI
jgi:hypothetical protein